MRIKKIHSNGVEKKFSQVFPHIIGAQGSLSVTFLKLFLASPMKNFGFQFLSFWGKFLTIFEPETFGK